MYTLATAASSCKTNHVKHRAMLRHLRATTGHNCIKQLTDSEPSANRENMTTLQGTGLSQGEGSLASETWESYVALGPCGAAQPGRFRVVPRPDPQHLSPFNSGLCHYHTRAHPQQGPHRRTSKVGWSLAGKACSISELLLWLQPMAPAPSQSYPPKCAAWIQAGHGGDFPTPGTFSVKVLYSSPLMSTVSSRAGLVGVFILQYWGWTQDPRELVLPLPLVMAQLSISVCLERSLATPSTLTQDLRSTCLSFPSGWTTNTTSGYFVYFLYPV